MEKATTSTTVVATPSPSVEEQPVQLVASVVADAPGSGDPSGTVTFLADGEPVGSAPVEAGQARLEVADLAPGSYQVTARYGGDGDYVGSTSEATSHTVIAGTAIVATATTLSSSENPSAYGGLITFTADVDATDGTDPAGAVQFSVDGVDLGDPVPLGADGVAEGPALASPDPGDHTVIAAYLPAAGYAGSGDLLVQTVRAADVGLELTSTDAVVDVGTEVTFTAAVTSTVPGAGTPTGWVQFAVDGVPLGDAVRLAAGAADSPTVADLGPGDHTVTATYSGDVRFAPAVTTLTQSVRRAATTATLDVSDASVTYGDEVEVTTTVVAEHDRLGPPTGTVTFYDGDTALATVAVVPLPDGASGTATLTVPDLGAGDHRLRAVYAGGDRFEDAAAGPVTVAVARLATKVAPEAALVSLNPLGLPLGQLKVTLTAGGRSLPGAPVEFKVGAKVVCVATTDARGVAACNAAAQLLNLVLGGGYTASYAGDADHLPATARGGILK